MKQYGKVVFGKGGERGATLQRTLNTRLNQQGVITVPVATIEKWFEEDKATNVGSVNSYVLHNKEEADIFRTIMESDEMQDESVKWKITRFNHDREFRKWVAEVDKKMEEEQLAEEWEKEKKNVKG